jgi:hypothetical protein
MFKNCLKGQASANWSTITAGTLAMNCQLTCTAMILTTLSNIMKVIENENLIHAQTAYISKLHQPVKSSPSEFRNQLLELTHLLIAHS